MAANEEAGTLESWLNKATNPLNTEEKWEYINGFCDQVNLELKGPQIAVRLLGHKIQSPQEKEALYALTVLDTCMNNCGKGFQNEVGKFRFLNELIKVLSPKYLGSWSSEQVKSKLIEMFYNWTVWLPNSVKIQDAYHMLKKQGIIKQDPKLPDEKSLLSPSSEKKCSLFDDNERSKLLARLLKSNQPKDLQAANRLIKSVVREDEENAEKTNKRIRVIEEVTNSIKLLNEMLAMYQKDGLPVNQLEILKNLHQRCEKLRPTLFRLASDTVENDEALVEILQTNDSLADTINSYKKIVQGHEISVAPRNSAKTETTSLLSDLSDLELDFGKPKTNGGSDCEQQLLCLDEELMSPDLNDPSLMEQAVNQNTSQETTPATTTPTPTSSESGDLGSLDLLGPISMEPFLQHQKQEQPCIKPSPKELQSQSPAGAVTATLDPCCPATSAPPLLPQPLVPLELTHARPSQPQRQAPVPHRPSIVGSEELSWKRLFVPVVTIETSHIPPVTVYDKNGFRVLLHFAKASSLPSQWPDLLVVIISLLSTLPAPIKDIVFQAAVPKVMRVKLQPASGAELTAFNPLFPPPVISQVMLIDNPRKEKVRLRYKLHYTLAEQSFTETGEVAEFPAVETWGSL